MEKMVAFCMVGISFIFLMYLWICIIVKIYKTHKEDGDSIKECISYINIGFFMLIILLSFLFIISIYAIRTAEIEYRIKRLNGEWKENSQRIEKTRPEVIYTDDISDFDVNVNKVD